MLPDYSTILVHHLTHQFETCDSMSILFIEQTLFQSEKSQILLRLDIDCSHQQTADALMDVILRRSLLTAQ